MHHGDIDVMVRLLDLQLRGQGLDSQPFHFHIQKFLCCGTAPVEHFASYTMTDNQLRTVLATSESTFIYSLEIVVHYDVFNFFHTIQILLLTYIMTLGKSPSSTM